MNARDIYLEQALEELDVLRAENEELKRKLSKYEQFINQTKEILNRWKEKDEKSGV